MRPEEYRGVIKRLETTYQEFLRTSQGSEMFKEEDKKNLQGHFDRAQEHYDTLVVQLPNYSECISFALIFCAKHKIGLCRFKFGLKLKLV